MNTAAFAQTDIGLRRENNEDRFLVDEELGLFVVCDGVGGHSAGEIAAQRGVELVAEYIRQHRDILESIDQQPRGPLDVLQLVEQAIRQACRELYELAQADSALAGMGTTLSLLLVVGEKAVIGHVGDSRIYLKRGQNAHLMTTDHTLANELYTAGQLTAEQARGSKFSNMLMRSVGPHASVVVDSLLFDLMPDDRFLLCSDGLSNYFHDDQEIITFLDDENVASAPQRFVELAKSRGGSDNITVVTVEIENTSPRSFEPEDLKQRIEALEKSVLFGGLSLNRLLRLVNICEISQFNEGSRPFRKDATLHGLYLVLSGTLSVESGKRQIATLGPGDFFGAESLMRDMTCRWMLTAQTPARLLCIPGDSFRQLTRRQPKLGRLLLHRLACHLSEKLDVEYSSGSTAG